MTSALSKGIQKVMLVKGCCSFLFKLKKKNLKKSIAAIEQLLPEYVSRAGNFKIILGKSDINLLQFFL